MKREELERIFCWKISAELKGFKYKIMQMEKEEIYALAYQIDCIVRIYENLVEESGTLKDAQLKRCMEISNLLQFIYEKWLEIPDSQEHELRQAIQFVLKNHGTEAA